MLVEPPRSSQSDQQQDEEEDDGNGDNGDWRPTKPSEHWKFHKCHALVKHCGDLPVCEEEEGLGVGEA